MEPKHFHIEVCRPNMGNGIVNRKKEKRRKWMDEMLRNKLKAMAKGNKDTHTHTCTHKLYIYIWRITKSDGDTPLKYIALIINYDGYIGFIASQTVRWIFRLVILWARNRVIASMNHQSNIPRVQTNTTNVRTHNHCLHTCIVWLQINQTNILLDVLKCNKNVMVNYNGYYKIYCMYIGV